MRQFLRLTAVSVLLAGSAAAIAQSASEYLVRVPVASPMHASSTVQ